MPYIHEPSDNLFFNFSLFHENLGFPFLERGQRLTPSHNVSICISYNLSNISVQVLKLLVWIFQGSAIIPALLDSQSWFLMVLWFYQYMVPI